MARLGGWTKEEEEGDKPLSLAYVSFQRAVVNDLITSLNGTHASSFSSSAAWPALMLEMDVQVHLVKIKEKFFFASRALSLRRNKYLI